MSLNLSSNLHFKLKHRDAWHRIVLPFQGGNHYARLVQRVAYVTGRNEKLDLFWDDGDDAICLNNDADLEAAADFAAIYAQKFNCVPTIWLLLQPTECTAPVSFKSSANAEALNGPYGACFDAHFSPVSAADEEEDNRTTIEAPTSKPTVPYKWDLDVVEMVGEDWSEGMHVSTPAEPRAAAAANEQSDRLTDPALDLLATLQIAAAKSPYNREPKRRETEEEDWSMGMKSMLMKSIRCNTISTLVSSAPFLWALARSLDLEDRLLDGILAYTRSGQVARDVPVGMDHTRARLVHLLKQYLQVFNISASASQEEKDRAVLDRMLVFDWFYGLEQKTERDSDDNAKMLMKTIRTSTITSLIYSAPLLWALARSLDLDDKLLDGMLAYTHRGHEHRDVPVGMEHTRARLEEQLNRYLEVFDTQIFTSSSKREREAASRDHALVQEWIRELEKEEKDHDVDADEDSEISDDEDEEVIDEEKKDEEEETTEDDKDVKEKEEVESAWMWSDEDADEEESEDVSDEDLSEVDSDDSEDDDVEEEELDSGDEDVINRKPEAFEDLVVLASALHPTPPSYMEDEQMKKALTTGFQNYLIHPEDGEEGLKTDHLDILVRMQLRGINVVNVQESIRWPLVAHLYDKVEEFRRALACARLGKESLERDKNLREAGMGMLKLTRWIEELEDEDSDYRPSEEEEEDEKKEEFDDRSFFNVDDDIDSFDHRAIFMKHATAQHAEHWDDFNTTDEEEEDDSGSDVCILISDVDDSVSDEDEAVSDEKEDKDEVEEEKEETWYDSEDNDDDEYVTGEEDVVDSDDDDEETDSEDVLGGEGDSEDGEEDVIDDQTFDDVIVEDSGDEAVDDDDEEDSEDVTDEEVEEKEEEEETFHDEKVVYANLSDDEDEDDETVVEDSEDVIDDGDSDSDVDEDDDVTVFENELDSDSSGDYEDISFLAASAPQQSLMAAVTTDNAISEDREQAAQNKDESLAVTAKQNNQPEMSALQLKLQQSKELLRQLKANHSTAAFFAANPVAAAAAATPSLTMPAATSRPAATAATAAFFSSNPVVASPVENNWKSKLKAFFEGDMDSLD